MLSGRKPGRRISTQNPGNTRQDPMLRQGRKETRQDPAKSASHGSSATAVLFDKGLWSNLAVSRRAVAHVSVLTWSTATGALVWALNKKLK